MKRALVALAAAGVLLTGCSNEPVGTPDKPDADYGLKDAGAHFWQDLGDGTKVECWFISYHGGYNSGMGGPTCDWIAYHQTYDKAGK